MNPVLQTVLIMLPSLVVAYTSWRQSRQYQALCERHRHFCMTAACLLRTHGKQQGSAHALMAPIRTVDELANASLHVIVLTDDNGAAKQVGLAVEFTNHDGDGRPRRKREVEPVTLDADMQVALARA